MGSLALTMLKKESVSLNIVHRNFSYGNVKRQEKKREKRWDGMGWGRWGERGGVDGVEWNRTEQNRTSSTVPGERY